MPYRASPAKPPEPTAAELDTPLSLSVAAAAFDMSYFTLAQAVREGRVQGVRQGGRWTVTARAVLTALEQGSLRPDWGRS